MRVCIAIRHLGLLRHYGPVIQGLCEAGHTVELFSLLSRDKHGEAVQLEALRAGCGSALTVSTWPRARGISAWLTSTVRRSEDVAFHVRHRSPARVLARVVRVQPWVGWLVRGLVRARIPYSWLLGGLRRLDRGIPPSRAIRAVVRRSDVIVVSPPMDVASPVADVVKAAARAGIRSVGLVPSWDSLTTKGTFHLVPDAVGVWNEALKAEAVELHRVQPSRVVVTGSPRYGRRVHDVEVPNRDTWLRQAGLPAGRPYVLWVGSSPFLVPAEATIVRDWLAALRRHSDSCAREISALIRPHPSRRWPSLVDDLGAVVWEAGPDHYSAAAEADYLAMLWHARAVVGIDTTALWEAAALGRPCLSFGHPLAASAQGGTPHWRHLVRPSGPVVYHGTIGEHVTYLAGLLAELDRPAEALDCTRAFLRPVGDPVAATVRLIEGRTGLRYVTSWSVGRVVGQ